MGLSSFRAGGKAGCIAAAVGEAFVPDAEPRDAGASAVVESSLVSSPTVDGEGAGSVSSATRWAVGTDLLAG